MTTAVATDDVTLYELERGVLPDEIDFDPVTTEVIRNSLKATADHMGIALLRAAFSPIIYDVKDYACALYDRQVRLLAQGEVLPFFLGTLGVTVEAAVAAVGGEASLAPGDVIVTNYAAHTGGHANDVTVVLPAFAQEQLVGYAAIKAHHLDLGAKEMFPADASDMHQEGTFYPGVKLYERGERQDGLWRTMLANTRLPEEFAGDLGAQIGGARLGLDGLLRIIERHGLNEFARGVEAIFAHGEAVCRHAIEGVPDGRYTAFGLLDDNGVTPDAIPFEIAVEVDGDSVTIDLTSAPEQQAGGINCPIGSTLSASRAAIMSLVGGPNTATEGDLRPVKVRTRRRTIFDPELPAPTILYYLPGLQLIELIQRALGEALPEVPAGSGGDMGATQYWGERPDGSFWGDGADHSMGQGAFATADGGAPLMHLGASGTRTTLVEMWEANNPFLVEETELIPDSGGAGRFQGGPGALWRYRALRDCFGTLANGRTKQAPWGVRGGKDGTPCQYTVIFPDASRKDYSKVTGLTVRAGTVIEIRSGGGGGYGSPHERDVEAVHRDIREGYITEQAARARYPHAFPDDIQEQSAPAPRETT